MIVFHREGRDHGSSLHGAYYGYGIKDDTVELFDACSCFHETGYHDGGTKEKDREEVKKICIDSRFRDYPVLWENEQHHLYENKDNKSGEE